MRCECGEDSRSNPNPRGMYLEQEYKAMKHAPGECPGDYGVKTYLRGGIPINLCSCCNLTTDVEVTRP